MDFDRSVATFLVLLALLLVADGVFYRFAGLAAKRRYHLAWQIGAFLVFLASLKLLRDHRYDTRLIIPASILFTFLDLARIRFCEACGRTVRRWRRRPCPRCARRWPA